MQDARLHPAHTFEHDRSAARGQMSSRGLYVFDHQDKLGNAHALFDRVEVWRKPEVAVADDYGDYKVTVEETNPPAQVTLLRKAG